MGESLSFGTPPVAVAIRRHRGARNLTLRVSHASERVTLTAPPGTSRAALEAFVASKSAWLAERLAERPGAIDVAPGLDLPFAGRPCRLQRGDGRVVRRDDGVILVPGEGTRFRARLKVWLMEEARRRLAAAADRHAAALGRRYSEIRLRDTRSRWGSCSSDGRLMFNWRLVMAPAPVLDYVAGHEAAHLVEMNHSARYWSVLRGTVPDLETPRAWLRSPAAAELHRYRF